MNMVGKGYVFDYGTATITKISGSASTLNIQSATISLASKSGAVEGQDGEICARHWSGKELVCEFTTIPEGSSKANALISVNIGDCGQGYNAANFPNVSIGPFTDAFNTGGANTQPWVYDGDAKLNLTNTDKATLTFTMKRAIGITSATAIT
jgi:hypothetical protein